MEVLSPSKPAIDVSRSFDKKLWLCSGAGGVSASSSDREDLIARPLFRFFFEGDVLVEEVCTMYC